MDEKINNLHAQMERLFMTHGVETFVSIRTPKGETYEIAVAKTKTLNKIKNSLEKK